MVAESDFLVGPTKNFYFHIWGGEDIHIGLYRSDDEPIANASRRTVHRMAELAGDINPASRVLETL